MKIIIRSMWDRIAGWGLVALGGVALLLGWLGVSGTAFPAEQIPYIISGGMVGIALVGVGATLLISADLRDEWRKLDDIDRALNSPPRLEPPPTELEAVEPPPVRRREPLRATS